MVLEARRVTIKETYGFKHEPPTDCQLYINGLMFAVQDGVPLTQAYDEAKKDVEASKHRDTTYNETMKTLTSAYEYLVSEGIK